MVLIGFLLIAELGMARVSCLWTHSRCELLHLRLLFHEEFELHVDLGEDLSVSDSCCDRTLFASELVGK